MTSHIFEAGDFFTCSPKIRIRKNCTVEDTVREAKIWTKQHAEKGGQMNCQLRTSSDEERGGHLVRLIGVEKMHTMLLELKDKTEYKLIYHKKEKEWCVSDDESPCGMLAVSDKWWMISWDECYLRKYGHRRRAEESCVPVQMKGGQWYSFAAHQCMYCNRTYDKTISSA